MKLRFSLRGLFLLAALICGACYWRSQPHRIANEFGQLIASANDAEADAMFIDDSWTASAFMTNSQRHIEVEPMEQSVSQWLRGVCPIALTLHDSSTTWLPLRPGTSYSSSHVLLLVASAGGVKPASVADTPRTAQIVADKQL
jgi:hypothetical protein